MSKASQKSSLIQIIEDFKTEGDARLVVVHTSYYSMLTQYRLGTGTFKVDSASGIFYGEKISNIILEKTFFTFWVVWSISRLF